MADYKYFKNIHNFFDRYEEFLDRLENVCYFPTVEEDDEFYDTVALRIATAICCDLTKETANCVARAILANDPKNI